MFVEKLGRTMIQNLAVRSFLFLPWEMTLERIIGVQCSAVLNNV